MMEYHDFTEEKTDSQALSAFYRSFENERSPVKILLKIFQGNYGKLVLSVFFYLLQASPVIILPIVTADIINIATEPEQYSLTRLIVEAVIMALVILQNVFTTFLSSKYRSLAIRRVELGLRAAMTRKLQQLSLTFHKEMKSGKLQSKIMRDVENIEGLATNLSLNLVSVAYYLISAIIITLIRSRIVFFFFLLTVPIAVLIVAVFHRRLARQNADFRHQVENTSAQVIEMIDLVPITKAHALEDTALSRLNRQLFRQAGSGFALDKLNAIFGSVSWVAFHLFQLGCLTFTGVLAYHKLIPVGDIVLYQSYFSSIVGQVAAVIGLLPIISRGFESVRSVGDIMWAMDVEDNRNKEKITDVRGDYEFRNVTFEYHDDPHRVLNGLSLKIHAGETIALVGESGSGKSTVLNMIIGFYRPTTGQVLMDGKDMTAIDMHSYRSHLATVPQTSVLFAGTIRENITYGMDYVTEEQLQEAIRIANLKEVIEKLPNGLETSVGEHGDKLSGGQKQRIAIARAVIRDARVILFDEATSALDTVSEKLIQDSIEKLSKNRTTFIVAHRLSTIRNADKIAVIKDGICSEFGTYEELMAKKGEFYRFKTLQS